MPDIQLRFNKDMLVLSAPIDAVLARQGFDAARDRQYLNLMEPEAITDALKLEVMAGAQCLVTATEDITPARLAHVGMDGNGIKLAASALAAAHDAKPQHVLVEIGPCGLPLDASSKSSLNENRGQYYRAARAFESGRFDAFFLNGFTSLADLKCALMGIAQVSDKPVFASVTVGGEQTRQASQALAEQARRANTPANLGTDARVGEATESAIPDTPFVGYDLLERAKTPPLPAAARTCLDPSAWPEALDAMVDLGASVVGFETADPIDKAVEYVATAQQATDLPILAQLRISPDFENAAGKNLIPLAEMTDYTPDTMTPAAVKLYGAGVQFLRATGAATPAFTGSLAATVMGLDVHRDERR